VHAVAAVALAAVVAALTFPLKAYRIPSESMVPTLKVGQRVIGNRWSDPALGEGVGFHPPREAIEGAQCANRVPPRRLCDVAGSREDDIAFIKRVVGLPGDRLRVRRGKVIRNGKPLRESYAEACAGDAGTCDFSGEITVPRGTYYVLGDNRGASDDSRFWGPVRREWFIGGAFATYWPPKKIGLL